MELKRGIREIERDSFENYRQKYPENYPLVTFKIVLQNLVKNIPDKTAFIQGERELTWKQFDERTNKVAKLLLALGLKKGDRVAINGFNSIEWVEAFLGASKAGFAPVNLNPRYIGDEAKYVLEDSDSIVLFTEDRWIDVIEEIREALPLVKRIIVYHAPGHPRKENPGEPIYEDYEDALKKYPATAPELDWDIKNDDLCYFKYTGGTTGYPKGVVFDNWRGCGGMRWGMFSTLLDSGWDKLVDSPFIKNLMAGLSLLTGSKAPEDVMDLVGSEMSKSFLSLMSETFEMLSDPSVLKSKTAKKYVIQSVVPFILGQPLGYRLLGGVMNMLHCAPLFHGLGWNTNMMGICAFGSTSIYLEPAHPFDVKVFWETVAKRRPTGTSIVGDAFAIPMIEELEGAKKEGRPYDLSSLTYIGSSGVRWSANLKRRFLEEIPHCTIIDGYGIAESVGGYASVSSTADEKITEHTTSVMDSFGYAAKRLVLDLDTGKPAKPRCSRAQFLYGGPHVGLGYWKAPELTRKTYIDVGEEKYVISGDEGYLDEDGEFHLLGRGGEYMINTGGEKVYAEEVEEVIKANPKVRDVAVIGIPDRRWGEAVIALLELNPGGEASEEEMLQYCRAKMARYKVPKNFIFHKVFRTEAGKIDRAKTRELVFQKLGLEK